MDNLTLEFIFGVALGFVNLLLMALLKYEDSYKKMEATSAAFIDRFMLGFLIPNIDLGIHPVVTGGLLSLGLSLPSAIINLNL